IERLGRRRRGEEAGERRGEGGVAGAEGEGGEEEVVGAGAVGVADGLADRRRVGEAEEGAGGAGAQGGVGSGEERGDLRGGLEIAHPAALERGERAVVDGARAGRAGTGSC